MVKTILFTLFFSLNMVANNCDSLEKVRNMFQSGVENKEELNIMIDFCKKSNCEKTIPYYAAATMRKAEFVWSPLDKLANFNKGKKMLESFIAKNPENIEAKYIRWLTQKMAPRFLGYHQNIENDYRFIQKNITKSDIEKSYQKVILHHIQKLKNE